MTASTDQLEVAKKTYASICEVLPKMANLLTHREHMQVVSMWKKMQRGRALSLADRKALKLFISFGMPERAG